MSRLCNALEIGLCSCKLCDASRTHIPIDIELMELMVIVQSYFTPIHTALFAGSERMTWSCFLRLWRKKPLLWDRRKKTWKNINLNWIFCSLKNYTMSRYSDRFTPISIWCVGLLVYAAVSTYRCIGFCFLIGFFAIYDSPTCFHNSAIYPNFTNWFVPEIDSCSKKS